MQPFKLFYIKILSESVQNTRYALVKVEIFLKDPESDALNLKFQIRPDPDPQEYHDIGGGWLNSTLLNKSEPSMKLLQSCRYLYTSTVVP